MFRRNFKIPGASSEHLNASTPAGLVNPGDDLVVTLELRENPQGPSVFDVLAGHAAASDLFDREYISTDDRRGIHGVSDDDLERVQRFAHKYGLEVDEVDSGGHTVNLRGSAKDMERAFHVALEDFQDHNGNTFRGHRTAARLPKYLQGAVLNVLGLDTHAPVRPHFRTIPTSSPNAAQQVIYEPAQLAKAFNFPGANTPQGVDGTGVVVGLIELGGQVTDADISAYFKATGQTPPKIIHVPVLGQAPTSDPGGADVEVALDVEVAGGLAPGLTIVVYDAPNTTQGVLAAINAAANDTVNNPMAISMSWGGPEINGWSAADMQSINTALASAVATGKTFFFSSGDAGFTDGVSGTTAYVDFPASSPYAFGAGGVNTQIVNNILKGVSAWGGTAAQIAQNGASGGGVSQVFGVPTYQSAAGIDAKSINPGNATGRAVPDAAWNGDPMTAVNVTSDGTTEGVGGTSEASPALATLVALYAKMAGKGLGWLNPLAYKVGLTGMNKVESGTNGGYSANANGSYNEVTGFGVPDGEAWGAALGIPGLAAPSAPTPSPAPQSPVTTPAPAAPTAGGQVLD